MDTAQWAQGNIGVVKVPMVELGSNPIPKPHHHHHVAPNNSNSNPNPNIAGGMQVERKARPQKDQALNCPRCNSSNTKFCYYNNYSLSQPRYFCKTCRRYWTEGGSLRNVPVGGGSRKNKRPSNSNHSSSPNSTTSTSSLSNSNSNLSSSIMSPNSNSSSSSSKKLPEASHHHHHHHNPKTNNNIIHQPQDLNLAYPPPPHDQISSTCATRGFNLMSSLMPMSVSSSDHASLMYSNRSNNSNNNNSGGGGFIPLQEFKPLHQGLNFSFEGFENNTNGNGNGNGYVSGFQGIQLGDSGAARILFPIEDLKHLPTTTTTTTSTTPTHEFEQHNHNHNQRGGSHGDSTGFWSGMLGGGSW